MDLIHLHFLAVAITSQQFPPFIQSIAQNCKHGGSLVWTEAELPITTSLACKRFCSLVLQGLQAKGLVFSHGNSIGLTTRMDGLLGDARCQITQSKAYAIDISQGSRGNAAFLSLVRMASMHIRTLLIETGVTTEAEFEPMFVEIQQEMQKPQFCGLLYLRTIVGRKA